MHSDFLLGQTDSGLTILGKLNCPNTREKDDWGLDGLKPGNLYWREKSCEVDLLVLTSLNQLILILQTSFTFFKISSHNEEVKWTELSPSLVFLVNNIRHGVKTIPYILLKLTFECFKCKGGGNILVLFHGSKQGQSKIIHWIVWSIWLLRSNGVKQLLLK